MGKLEMKISDLGELYVLLGMYHNTYGSVPEELMEDIARRYREMGTGKKEYGGKGIPAITNPRGAGRRSDVKWEEKEIIQQLHREGRSIREIAKKTGRSSGCVHKLIHEQG